jgi:hypothetical protein
MFFERGNMIRIGMKFWHGGSWELAKYLNYDNPGIFWCDGDIESLDKCVKDWQLYLYIAAGKRYFNWENMNRPQKKMLTRLIRLLMYHISNKVVLEIGTFWRFIRGVMYSGGKETSHGDSWIMALVFFLYINDVCSQYPNMAPVIMEQVNLLYIVIVVYGDDHIWSCPKFLRHIINVQSFARFLKEVCDMNLRDYKEYDEFLSIPDKYGDLIYKGPKFLKRYFIASNEFGLPPVLPYKPMNEAMLKMFFSESGVKEDYILKAIGAAYDSMGTNKVFYNMVREFYSTMIRGDPRTPAQMYADASSRRDLNLKINKWIYLHGMTPSQLFDHFPSMKELMRRHVYDENYVKYGDRADYLFGLNDIAGIVIEPMLPIPLAQ